MDKQVALTVPACRTQGEMGEMLWHSVLLMGHLPSSSPTIKVVISDRTVYVDLNKLCQAVEELRHAANWPTIDSRRF